jgi:hypothetical protein
MCVERDIEARSRNHCCRGKSISIKYSEFVSVFLPYLSGRKSHFSAPYYTVMCGLSGSTKFFHIIPHTARFAGGGLLNIECVL